MGPQGGPEGKKSPNIWSNYSCEGRGFPIPCINCIIKCVRSFLFAELSNRCVNSALTGLKEIISFIINAGEPLLLPSDLSFIVWITRLPTYLNPPLYRCPCPSSPPQPPSAIENIRSNSPFYPPKTTASVPRSLHLNPCMPSHKNYQNIVLKKSKLSMWCTSSIYWNSVHIGALVLKQVKHLQNSQQIERHPFQTQHIKSPLATNLKKKEKKKGL